MKRSPRRELLDVAQAQHGAFRTDQASLAGVSRRALERWRAAGEIRHAGRGVWVVVGSPNTPERNAMAAVLQSGLESGLAGTSAAWLWEVPGHRLEPVAVLRGRSKRCTAAGLHSSRSVSADDFTIRRGVRVTTPVRTIFDLAGQQHERRTRRDLNLLMARGLVDLERLDEGLDRLGVRGRTGITLMRELIAEAREKGAPAGSSLELLAEEILRSAGFDEIERQAELGDELGPCARVDFVDRRRRVAFEVDSDRFHGGLVDRMVDAAKTARLEQAGWKVVRITEHELWWDRTGLTTRMRTLRYRIASLRSMKP